MKRLHARYPFLETAREAVQSADVDLVDLVQREDAPAVERAVERVDTALSEGTIGPPHRRPRVELLSYPIARVLVSLVDEHVLLRKYAHAEAAAARERFEADRNTDDQLKSTSGERLTVERLLAEFDLAGTVRSSTDGYQVAVGEFLRLSADLDGDDWRLATRALADGFVPVDGTELDDLLQEAIRERVADGLPLTVPDAIADGLEEAVEQIEDALADRQLSHGFDAVVPEDFPPCVQALLERAEAKDELGPTARFTLTAFLTSVGLTPEEVAELSAGGGFDAETIRYQAAHLATTDAPEYPPPGCTTMVAYDLCVNRDDLCERIDHPLNYYEKRLDDDPTPVVE